jgi:hypothetical protein
VSFVWFSLQTVIISLNSVNQMMFVMVKCGVLSEAGAESNIYTSSVFKGLNEILKSEILCNPKFFI